MDMLTNTPNLILILGCPQWTRSYHCQHHHWGCSGTEESWSWWSQWWSSSRPSSDCGDALGSSGDGQGRKTTSAQSFSFVYGDNIIVTIITFIGVIIINCLCLTSNLNVLSSRCSLSASLGFTSTQRFIWKSFQSISAWSVMTFVSWSWSLVCISSVPVFLSEIEILYSQLYLYL